MLFRMFSKLSIFDVHWDSCPSSHQMKLTFLCACQLVHIGCLLPLYSLTCGWEVGRHLPIAKWRQICGLVVWVPVHLENPFPFFFFKKLLFTEMLKGFLTEFF